MNNEKDDVSNEHEGEMNNNAENYCDEAVYEIDVSEDENMNETYEFDFEEIDFGSLNEDEVKKYSHELVGEHSGGMVASNRRMIETDFAQRNTMREDMYNQIQKQRRIKNGDTKATLQYLKDQSKSDCAMYWSIFDYSIFGDVLSFDANYGRNKYKFSVVIFPGVNHHKQTTVFVVVVVSNETKETYV
ncbi:hypothetical protein Lal_00036663 [Lupinus albus]|nr:hypothetical protein Lal_00036663 [Lupinus albus]